MPPIVKTKRRRSRRPVVSVHKPQGVLQPRVRRVGPEPFGIVAIDCAKARSMWMLCDFFGTMLVPPTELPHSRGHFAAAIARLRAVQQEQRIEDLIVAIERTGRYHRPAERAFRAAGLETRLVHPFATKRLRESSDPGNKTDDKDLAAIFRAASIGFGLLDPPLDAVASQLRLWARHRCDLSLEVLANLQTATAQLDPQDFPAETVPLARQLERTSAAHRRGPMPLADILPLVLAKLGASHVQSINGEPGPG